MTTLEVTLAKRMVERKHARQLQSFVASDSLDWLQTRAKVQTQEAVLDFRILPWHRRVASQLTGRDVIVKSRDVGASTFFVGLRLQDLMARPPGNLLIAADRGDNAVNLVDYARTIMLHLPPREAPRITKDNTTEIEFWPPDAKGTPRRCRVQAITASPRAGRSYRCRHLICTEMGFWEDDRRYWAAVTGAVAAGGTIVAESTWPERGAHTVYGKLWSDPSRGFTRHFIGRNDVPWHDARWEATRRTDLTVADFAREHPDAPSDALEAPAEGAFSVFSKEALRRAHDLEEGSPLSHVPDTMVFEPDGTPRIRTIPVQLLPESVVIELGPPEPGRRYLTFWDLGQSRGRGATVGITLDVTWPFHFIRMIQRYEELPWPGVQDAIAKTHHAFPGETWVEVNGPGDPVIANLAVSVNGFWTTGATKVYMIKETVTRMEQGGLKWPPEQAEYPELAQLDLELELYEWKDTNLVQDCVIALCGAEYCALAGATGFMR